MLTKDIRDAVHGDMEFDSFELDIINTPEFQRMRSIRQLGLAHLVYPAAQHSRFEHSLGVAHMASRIIDAVRKNCGPETISKPDERFVRALALIHDIGHIPFGHTLEDERPIFDSELHHDGTARLGIFLDNSELGSALAALGKDLGRDNLAGDLIRVMKHTHEDTGEAPLDAKEKLLANIVGNTICADLLDYLKRDPYFTGIRHTYDEKIIAAFEVKDSRIFLNLVEGTGLRRSVLSEILHLLRLRYTLGERVYYHPTKAAASAMVSKAVELSELPHTSLAKLRDEELLYILENGTRGQKAAGGDHGIKNHKKVVEIVSKIRRRQLYKPVYLVTRSAASHTHDVLDGLVRTFHHPSSRRKRAEIESKIAKAAGIDPSEVIVYCPDKKMSTKAAMVEVLWPKDHALKPLQELCEKGEGFDDEVTKIEIDGLRRKHEALWQLTVFADSRCTNDKLQAISAYCENSQEFHQIKNAIRDYEISPKESIFNKNFVTALSAIPADQFDRDAMQELASASFFKGRDDLTVEQIRQYITTKEKDQRQQLLGFDQRPADGGGAVTPSVE